MGSVPAFEPPNNRVSQYYRNTLDELTRISVWVCDADTHRLHVDVLDSAQQAVRIADGYGATPAGYCGWLDIDLSPNTQPVRGRTYKVVVSRPSGQPISFAYDPTNKYRYGCLLVGSTAHDSWDLAARTAV